MKYKYLRTFMKKKNLSRPYKYANNALVVDGICFKDMYKISGCQYILGGEYDRFASSLKNLLNMYVKSGIQCYVVFPGVAKSDMNTRAYIHQKIIDKTDAITPGGTYEYSEPIFVRDVCKDVLDELEIKHFTCKYGSKEVLFKLAKILKCPILTNCFEYALYGVSVIPFRSTKFNEEIQSIEGSIYFNSICRRLIPFPDDLMSVLMTVADEDSVFYGELLDMLSCRPDNYIPSMLYWMRRKDKESAVKFIKSYLKEEKQQVFINTVAELRVLFNISTYLLGVNFLTTNATTDRKQRLGSTSADCFEYDIGVGRIATPFINLKSHRVLSGSWVVYNESREDAMLAAIDIVFYAQALLRKSQEVKITFIGRKYNVCDVSVIKKIVNIESQYKEREENKKRRLKSPGSVDHFLNFVKENLPGFDLTTLESVPEECWILLITLLYYDRRAKVDTANVIRSIILSYVLLGHISEKVGVIKRSNFTASHGIANDESSKVTVENNTNIVNLTFEQCSKTASAVIELFYANETALKDNFDRDALHTLAEYQHCLHFMNYLNRLCGEKIKRTAYHKTINCTFIYNLFVTLKDENTPGDYIQQLINCSPVYSYFKNILDTYYKCSSMLKTN